jgi:hypothetical protein
MKTKTRDGNEEALDLFIANVIDIRTALEKIQKAADDHFYTIPEKVHYGDVGTSEWILGQLNEILDHLNIAR